MRIFCFRLCVVFSISGLKKGGREVLIEVVRSRKAVFVDVAEGQIVMNILKSGSALTPTFQMRSWRKKLGSIFVGLGRNFFWCADISSLNLSLRRI